MSNLRIAYAGHDFFAPWLKVLLDCRDVEVVLCLTHHAADSNEYFRHLAGAKSIPVIEGRLTDASIAVFNNARIDLLISAACYYKIPIDRLDLRYAVNVYPSFLPC